MAKKITQGNYKYKNTKILENLFISICILQAKSPGMALFLYEIIDKCACDEMLH